MRVLSDGRLLVNDYTTRRLVLFDANLKHGTVVADSTPSTNKAYGTPLGGIIAYRGDSTFFVDPTSISLVLLDPNGKSVRVIAPPRPAEIASLLNLGAGNSGLVAFDGHDGLIYRSNAGRVQVTGNVPGMAAPTPTPAPQTTSGLPPHDSAAIVRADIATHRVDTLAFMTMAITQPPRIYRDPDGNMTIAITVYPVSMSDDWAMLSDGSVAIVRASDYHIDWIGADGTRVRLQRSRTTGSV